MSDSITARFPGLEERNARCCSVETRRRLVETCKPSPEGENQSQNYLLFLPQSKYRPRRCKVQIRNHNRRMYAAQNAFARTSNPEFAPIAKSMIHKTVNPTTNVWSGFSRQGKTSRVLNLETIPDTSRSQRSSRIPASQPTGHVSPRFETPEYEVVMNAARNAVLAFPSLWTSCWILCQLLCDKALPIRARGLWGNGRTSRIW